MAKAVSLCMSRWIRLGWRKTDCPAKTVDRRNFLATDSTSFARRLDDVGSQLVAEVGREPELAGQIDVFSEGIAGRRFHGGDRLWSLERPDIHLGDGDEDEILVQARGSCG